jgi:hypothetical protein
MIDEVAMDDAQKASRHETVKATVGSAVDEEITEQAAVPASGDDARVSVAAAQIRETAIDDTVRGERTLGQARTAARGSQFLDYGFGVLYALLAIRLVLALIAAASTNGFVRFVTAVTNPFYAPFEGIVGSPSQGGHTLVAPLLIAIAAYALLHFGINGLLRMVGSRKTRI